MIANIENRAQQSAPTAPAYTRSNSSQNRLQAKLAEFKTACEASKETPSKAVHTQTDVSKMVKTLDADAARSPDVIISDQAKQKEENDKLEKDAAEFWAQNS